MRPVSVCAIALCLIALVSSASFCQDVYITGPQQVELTEGQVYAVDWSAGGAETVDILLCGQRTALGGRSRGAFEVPVAKGIPAVQGSYACTLPWVDALKLQVRIVGRDGAGNKVSFGQKEYRFRPATLAERSDDGIYVDLHQTTNQRLYVQKDEIITRAYLCSSSSAYRWLPTNVHPATPHDHAGSFKVQAKVAKAYSRQYDVEMPWALHYLAGHYIHATSPGFYKMLGQPASHGCIRLTREDARALFDATTVGTQVEVIGPQK